MSYCLQSPLQIIHSEPSYGQSLLSRRTNITLPDLISSLRALPAILIQCRTSAIAQSNTGNKRGSFSPRLPRQKSRPPLSNEYGVSWEYCIPMTYKAWPRDCGRRLASHNVSPAQLMHGDHYH